MSIETPGLKAMAYRLDAIADRLHNLELQVRGLVYSQTMEAKEFVVKDDRGEVRARLEMREYAPRLTFYDRAGERLSVPVGRLALAPREKQRECGCHPVTCLRGERDRVPRLPTQGQNSLRGIQLHTESGQERVAEKSHHLGAAGQIEYRHLYVTRFGAPHLDGFHAAHRGLDSA